MAPRSRSKKGEARRAQILQTAFEVLSQDGYRRSSLREIARALNVEPAHILYYFATREELLTEVVKTWQERTLERARAVSQSSDALDGWLDVVHQNAHTPGLVYVYTTFAAEAADPGHPAHSYFLERFNMLHTAVADAIRQRQHAGRARADIDADHAALRLMALSDGLQLQWLANPAIDMATELGLAINELAAGHPSESVPPAHMASSPTGLAASLMPTPTPFRKVTQ